MAGWFVVVGSVFLVLSVFDSIANLNSVAVRDEVTKVLSSSTGDGLGLSVSQALTLMRVGLMVTAACAAAAAVIGVYALQRHRSARLALSVLAVPILLSAPLTGGLIGALVAAATLMLWSGPARDWYAGRPVREMTRPTLPTRDARDRPDGQSPDEQSKAPGWPPPPPPPSSTTPQDDQPPADRPEGTPAGGPSAEGPPAEGSDEHTPTASSLSTSATSTRPGATQGFGTLQAPVPAAGQAPVWSPSAGAPAAPPADREVPTPVKLACSLTWAFSGTLALLYLVILGWLAIDPEGLRTLVADSPEWKRVNMSADVIVPGLWLSTLVVLAWTVGACVLAWFAWRRHDWARWLLAFSAGFALLVAMFAFPVGMLHQLACVLAIGGLFNARARAWFDQSPPPPPDQGLPGPW